MKGTVDDSSIKDHAQDLIHRFMDRLEHLAWFQVLVGLFQVGGKKQVGGSPQNPRKLVVIPQLLDMVGKISRFLFELTAGTLDWDPRQARDDPQAGRR